MADSTHAHNLRRRARLLVQAAAFAAILALASGWLQTTSARADGDPASDVLATQSLFLPQDAGVAPKQQAQLTALLQAAQPSGYRIRVALIASPADLGSVTALWRQPQNYAEFLGQELALVYRGPLLVVMPNAFGLFGGSLAAERSAFTGVRAPAAGAGLGSAALIAIQHLAAASGHALALPSPTTAASSPSSTGTTAWIAFALGGALVALAWTASLRARPLRLRGRGTSPESG